MKVARSLFLALFAAQAAAIVVSPVLGRVAADLDVSTATAGQLRTVSGLAAAGSLASAAAPTFAALAVAQIAIGVGIAALVSAAAAGLVLGVRSSLGTAPQPRPAPSTAG